jgi:hypothetical protein
METKVRSKTWNIGDYRTEKMIEIIQQVKDTTELLVIYLDQIRNFRELTDEMLENIEKFDEGSKMIIIREYNRVLKSVADLI